MLLARLESSVSDDTTLKLSWTKVNGADGYDVFLTEGASSDLKLYKSVNASESVIQFTGLDRGKIYKACVKAWKREKGEKTSIGDASPLVFAITGGYNARYCDPASVIIDVKRVVLKNGGTYRIRATLKGVRDGMDILNIMNDLRYFSSDTSVATVSETGKIKARGTGTCTVYILASNGIRASLEVRVK
jgi:hypothetical protein